MLSFAPVGFLIVCAMLVFSEISHRKTERQLMDRLLEKEGLAPLSEPEHEERTEVKAKPQPSKIIFNIPGMPQRKVGPLGGER